MAEAVMVTLGPRGRTVILQREYGPPQVVNSGVMVAAISANNDRSIGELLAGAIDKVGREGAITIEDGSGLQSELRVVDPPRVSPIPSSPNKPLLLLAVLLVSLAAGVATAVLRAQATAAFFDVRTLRARLGAPVLGAVSMVLDADGMQRRRDGVIAFSASLGAYTLLFVGLAAWLLLRTLTG